MNAIQAGPSSGETAYRAGQSVWPIIQCGESGFKGSRSKAAIPQRFVLGRIFGGLVVCISGFTVI
jgi:hypothetical protein